MAHAILNVFGNSFTSARIFLIVINVVLKFNSVLFYR